MGILMILELTLFGAKKAFVPLFMGEFYVLDFLTAPFVTI